VRSKRTLRPLPFGTGRWLSRTTLLATLLGLLAVPSSAGAAVTIGPSLSTAETAAFGCGVEGGCSYSQGTPAYTSPISGVVVSWAVRGGSGPLTLRILTGNRGGASSETRTPPTAGTESFLTRLGIAAGDRVGVDLPTGFVSQIGVRQPTGTAIDSWAPSLGSQTRAPNSSFPDYELLLNATIEPDADGDGFGDETQDACPTNGTTQGACPSTTPSPTGQRAAALKKCKKKHGAARQKCKKKANLLPV
jgi:hypothetical protein